MPLFKHRKVPKDETRKLVERRMVLARDSPEPTFDLSSCGMTEVPSGVFSLCKVLLKEALLLYDNELTTLKNGGHLRDLGNLRVFDLHDNNFTSLPQEIGLVTKLQILNLQNNKLKSLPKTIGNLYHLQTLNLQGNELQALPDEIGNLRSLRTLNISQNKLKAVTNSLAHVRTLENLIVDVDKLTFPPKDVTSGGTAAIMKYFCKSAGIEYIPPSQHLLPVLDPSSTNGHVGSVSPVDDLLAATLSAHEKEKELRKQQMLQLEKQMQDVEEQQKLLTAVASKHRQELMEKIRKNEEEMDDQVLWQQQKLEIEKKKKLSALAADEQLANDTVAMILQINERAKNTEMIMDELEKERIRTEQLIQVTQEEQDRLKKEEVLASMARMLESRANQDRLIREYEAHKDRARDEAVHRSAETDKKVLSIISNQQDDRMALMKDISNEEQAQIEALQALQLQKDAKHKRISNQIAMLQEELSSLSLVELEKREERLETEQMALQVKREGLTQLLTQLVDEQQSRELELMKRLVEMEEQRESDIKDYWLIQYQRLLDSKPQSILDKECDVTVMEVLNEAGADCHAALFSRHKITWDTMQTLTDSELKEMGVREVGLRKSILNVIQDRLQMNNKAKTKTQAIESESERQPEAAAPESELSAPPLLERAASVSNNAECVICMDRNSDIVLLPCGHVCCCVTCSTSLTSCPMCRQPVTQRIRMFIA